MFPEEVQKAGTAEEAEEDEEDGEDLAEDEEEGCEQEEEGAEYEERQIGGDSECQIRGNFIPGHGTIHLLA